MTKKSREFEQLVAIIERALLPKGAEIKSPDYVIDKVTGQNREVDATIRYTIGSTTVLIAIECRDHQRGQDVRWIEQIVTKSRDIGASHTIAVSSSRFSEAAISKAKAHGIEIRRIREVSDDEIASWVSEVTIEKIVIKHRIINYSVQYDRPDNEGPISFDKNISSIIQNNPFNGCILFCFDNNKGVSINDLLADWLNQEQYNLIREAERDNIVHHTIEIEFKPQEYYTNTTSGQRELSHVVMEVDFLIERELVPATRVYSYASPTHTITQIVEREIVPGQLTVYVQ